MNDDDLEKIIEHLSNIGIVLLHFTVIANVFLLFLKLYLVTCIFI